MISPAREHQLPPARHRTRSPVRYIRSPPPNGHATNRSPVSAARPRYPRARPRTRDVQLPGHPGRHRAQPRVQHEHPRIRDRRPDRRHLAPAVTRIERESTAVSVGPYKLCSSPRPEPPANRPASDPGSASPLQNTRRSSSTAPGRLSHERLQHRRHEMRRGHALPPDQPRQVPRIPMPPGRASTRPAPSAAARTTPTPTRRN